MYLRVRGRIGGVSTPFCPGMRVREIKKIPRSKGSIGSEIKEDYGSMEVFG